MNTVNDSPVIKEIMRTPDGARLYLRERAMLEVTELICKAMDEQGVSRSELAKRMGKSKGHISQLLDGDANMTVCTISDTFFALGQAVHFDYRRLDVPCATRAFEPISAEWPVAMRTWGPLPTIVPISYVADLPERPVAA